MTRVDITTDLQGSEQRRKRNRVSQRQFRERRNRHLKELEERVEFFSKNESERNGRLIAENKCLQNTLSRTQDQLLRIKNIFDELYETIQSRAPIQPATPPGTQVDRYSASRRSCFSETQATCESEPEGDDIDPGEGDSIHLPDSCDNLAANEFVLSHYSKDGAVSPKDQHFIGLGHGISPPQYPDGVVGQALEGLAVPTDNSMFNVDMSGAAFAAFMPPFDEDNLIGTFAGPSLRVLSEPREGQLLQRLFMLIDERLTMTIGSSLSERIDDMTNLTEDYLKLVGGFGDAAIVDRACLAAMIAFVKHASPLPAVMWFTSSCYSLVGSVIRGRLTSHSPSFQALLPNYEPSELQLKTSHPSVIDWIAFAGLRDKLIQHYNDPRKLDHVFLDLLEHLVVEVTDISVILTGVESGPGSLGVWNIFSVMTNGFSNKDIQALCTPEALELRDGSLLGLYQMHKFRFPNTSSLCRHTSFGKGFWIPVPLSTLLSSPQLARQLYHHLEVYDSHKYWKFDGAFFEKHPELQFDGFQDVVAKGRSYRVASHWIQATQAPVYFVPEGLDPCGNQQAVHSDTVLSQNS
ncbi:hypothetical protein LTS17_009511 [Exophiala oligosperma]